jgi:Glycosyl hydrolase family 63 C-terminal domain
MLDQGIPALTSAYNERFKNIFPIPSSYPTTNPQSLENFSKSITANLLGGVGYFYGTSIINKKFSYEWDDDDVESSSDDSEDEEKGPRLTEPRGLLTATPSRSFFPRGFYWFANKSLVFAATTDYIGIGTKASIYFTLANGITTSGLLVLSIELNSCELIICGQSRDFKELDRSY